MKYKALIDFLHDELGAIAEGDTVEATAEQALTPLAMGFFEATDADKPAKKGK